MRAKILTALLLAALALGLLLAPGSASAAAGDTFTAGVIKYNVLSDPFGDKNGVAEVIPDKYTGTSYSIPSTVRWGSKPYDVFRVGKDAFKDCANLRTITIGSNVSSIEPNAFSGSGLTGITFSKNSKLSSIRASAFKGCENLVAIAIPDSVTNIGKEAFLDCTTLLTRSKDGYLHNVKFGEGSKLRTLGENAFGSGVYLLETGVNDIYGSPAAWHYAST